MTFTAYLPDISVPGMPFAFVDKDSYEKNHQSVNTYDCGSAYAVLRLR
jgi:hypothetical protein